MSNDGKHHFHLKEYSILQLLYAGMNTPSDGNGITGIHSAVFVNEIANKKKKKWEINLNKKKFTQVVAVARFLIFQMPI